MTDTKTKALALFNEVLKEHGMKPHTNMNLDAISNKALCRAIEQREAAQQELRDFKQEVSDVVHHYVHIDGGPDDWGKLEALIIPKPDPLVDVMEKLGWYNAPTDADDLRAALDTAGFEIREKADADPQV